MEQSARRFHAPSPSPFPTYPSKRAPPSPQTLRGAVGSGVGGGAAAGDHQCTFAARRDLSLAKVAATALGAALFTHAQALTASTSFRLGAGALTFASGAAVVLLFVVMRSVPHKGKILAGFALSASSAAAAVRWAYGTWAPDLGALLTSRAALVYFLATGLLGLAATYWLDDPTNVKLNTTVSAALHLAGLLLVWLGTTSEPASFALMGLLVAARVLAPALRRLPGALRWAGAGAWALVRAVLGLLAAALRAAGSAALAALAAAGAAAGVVSKATAARAKQIRASASANLDDAAAAAGDALRHHRRREAAAAAAAAAPGAARRRSRPPSQPRDELLLSEDEAREAAAERRAEQDRVRRAQEMLRAQQRAAEAAAMAATASRQAEELARPATFGRWLDSGPVVQRSPSQAQEWRWPSEAAAAATAAAAPARPASPPQQWRPASPQQQRRPTSPIVAPAPAPAAVAAPSGGGWFSRWSGVAATATPAAAPSMRAAPLHLRTPPPEPASLTEERRRLQQQQQQQRASAPRSGGAGAARRAAAAAAAAGSSDDELSDDERGFFGRSAPQRSPWSSERLVVDITARRATPASAGGRTPAAARTPASGARRAAATPPGGGASGGASGGGDVSPLVQRGRILNPETGNAIQIGKPTYAGLIARGFTPDLKLGVLVPPADGGGGGGGNGAAATPKRGAARRR